MELLTISILTLLALYVIYSEPFKLPAIVKKNKNLVYILIIGLYLYYYQNNNVVGAVEGYLQMGDEDGGELGPGGVHLGPEAGFGGVILGLFLCFFLCCFFRLTSHSHNEI